MGRLQTDTNGLAGTDNGGGGSLELKELKYKFVKETEAYRSPRIVKNLIIGCSPFGIFGLERYYSLIKSTTTERNHNNKHRKS